jgi:hypothetical protein
MAAKKVKSKSPAKNYQGLNYRSLQQKNAADRAQLPRDQQKWLKQNGYRNVGWATAIHLHEKIADLQAQNGLEDSSLEELFLEADRIGNRYQTAAEIRQFQQAMAEEANAIADLIDQQFPETETEFIDFSQSAPSVKSRKQKNNSHQKTYRTLPV